MKMKSFSTNIIWSSKFISFKFTSRAFSAFDSVITPTAAFAANIIRITYAHNNLFSIKKTNTENKINPCSALMLPS